MASTVPSSVKLQGFGSSSHVARYSDGSFITVWTSFDAQGSAYVHGKVFGANGAVKKDTFLIDSAPGTASASYYDVTAAALNDGRTVIAWTRSDGAQRIVGKVLDSAYTPTVGLLEIGDIGIATGQETAKAYALQNGGFAVVYKGNYTGEDPGPSLLSSVFIERQNGWIRNESEAILSVASPGLNAEQVAVLRNGVYAFTLPSSDAGQLHLFTGVYSSGGDPSFLSLDSFPTNVTAIHSTVTPISNNRFIVAWQDGNVIRAQIVSGTATLEGSPVSVTLPAGTLVEAPVVSELEKGGFAIAFKVDVGNSDDNVYTAAFAANGSVIAGVTHVGTTTTGDQWAPSITALEDNTYAVTWMSDTATGPQFFVEVIGSTSVSPPPPPPPPGTTWTGTNGNDTRIGTDLSEIFKGLGGKDNIDGGAGDDTIWGGAGNDTLKGNAGRDLFVFDTKPNKSSNKDKIVDFSVKDDTIWLDNKIFTKLGKAGSETKPAQLKKGYFALDKARDKDDYIVYDRKKGVLYYDADGSGKGKAVEIATLSKKLAMTYKDFFVI